jgi:hypothetical protein
MRFVSLILCVLVWVAPVWAQSTSTPLIGVAENGTMRNFQACPEPNRWQTSAHYMRQTARCVYDEDPTNSDEAMRVALIEDIFIKSWSYAVLNKVFFWASLVFGLLVLFWPTLVAVFRVEPVPPSDPDAPVPKPPLVQRAFAAPSMQTTVTALAALCFAFYAHYKDKQAVSETLMRTVLFSAQIEQPLIDRVLAEISEMDRGFGFAKALPQFENKGQ